MLRVRGISYLVGGSPGVIRRDLEAIARDLRCTAVMLICADVEALAEAARSALEVGLDVWIRPDFTEVRRREVLERLEIVAVAAEELRREHPGRVTLLVGSEFSHTVPGIVPAPRSFLRLKLIIDHRRLLRRRIDRGVYRLLFDTARVARRHFRGPLGYSAAAWENPDWSLFDVVGVALYRSGRNRADYAGRLRKLVRDNDKPVVITEFGCGAFTGADDMGAASYRIVKWFSATPHVRDGHPRDETVQARHLAELIDLYDDEGVHGCFVFTFAMPDFPHREDRRLDLDRAGFGVVACAEDGTRRPKRAFGEVARLYGGMARRP
ncbi:hypothetical protein AB0I28_15435 [Phytomonospora sp. NPDC050363]|uniref:hypothetical protein n=1 Tax=Phytomonospora sp. NPDC050363 TaxID=3155642 RepID=UPI003410D7A0